MDGKREFCPAGVPLASRREIITARRRPGRQPITNSRGENILPIRVLGEGQIVSPDGQCGFETVGEAFNSAGWDVGMCTLCRSLCLVRKDQE